MNGKQLKNSILQWAIQGKLVPQDPNDEPASVLLERIREEKARLVKEKKIKKDKNESIIFRGDDNSHYEKFADGTVKCIDDEIPFEIPQSWCWCRFSAIYRLLTDGTHNTPKYTESGIPFISVKDMSSGKLSFSNTKFISEEEHKILSARCCPEYGDLLISKVGTTGIPLIIDTDKEFSIFVSLALIKFFQNHIDSKFLIHLINSPLVQEQVKRDTRGVGNKNWVLTAISNTLLAIPPLVEQKRIVSKIEEIMPIADKYEKSQEALDRLNTEIYNKLKKSVLQEAIQGKLVPQDPNDEPASVLLERIKEEKVKLFKEGKLKKKDLVDSIIFKGDDNKYYEKVGSQVTCIDDDIPFEIPSSWSWIRLGNYTDVIGGYAFQSQDLKSENGCRVIRISDISEDGLVNTRIVRYSGNLELSQYRIYNSDILMAMTGGTVGKSLLLKSDNKEVLLLNQRVAIIRNTRFDVNYIDTVIKSAYIKSIIDNSKNSTNDNISMADITGFLIPIPPLNEQHRIINKLEFVIASIMRR